MLAGVVTLLAILVVAPTGMLVLGAFSKKPIFETGIINLLWGGDFTLKNFQRLWVSFDAPRLFFNSLYVSVGSTLFSLVVGTGLAWIIIRTDVPWSRALNSCAAKSAPPVG